MNLIRRGTTINNVLRKVMWVVSLLTWGLASVATAGPICERSKAVIKALEGRLNLKCQFIAEHDLQEIAGLYITPTSPMILKSDDLVGLTNLKNLVLVATGSATGLPDGFWGPVSSTLEALNLTLTTKTLPSNTLEGLSHLKFLDLTLPEVVELNGGIFTELSSLNELHFRTLSIGSLPIDLLDGLGELKVLSFEQSDIGNLSKGLLSPVPNLEIFTMWSSKSGKHALKSIDSQFFAGLKSLRAIHVSDHKLLTIPSDLFQGLDNLESINFRDGPLIALSCDQFRGLKKLRLLNLSLTDIRTFKLAWLLDSAKTLEHLTIDHLPLNTELDIYQIRVFKKLRYLIMADINLTHIPAGAFGALSRLESISLSGNLISVLPDDFLAQSRKVQMVDIGHNPIHRIQNSTLFSKLSSLKYLNLPATLWDDDFEKIKDALPTTVLVDRH